MSISSLGTTLYVNNTEISMGSLKGTHKEQALDEQRNFWGKLTDFFGWTQHDKVISIMFDIVNPKDSATFQQGILDLHNLVLEEKQEQFRDALCLNLTKDVYENTIVTVSLDHLELTKIKFGGDFQLCNRLFAEDEDNEGNYKLKFPPELSKFIGNQREVEACKIDKIIRVKNFVSELLEQGPSLIYRRITADIERTVNHLPTTTDTAAVTKQEFLQRIDTIFGEDKGDSREALLTINDHEIKLRHSERQFIKKFNALPIKDKAYLLILVDQNFKAPLVGVAPCINSNALFSDATISTPARTPLSGFAPSETGLSSLGQDEFNFQMVEELNESVVQISGSTHRDFFLAQDGIPIQEEKTAAHQDAVGAYEVVFDKNGNLTDIKFAYSQFELVVHHQDGSLPSNHSVLKAKPSREFIDEFSPYHFQAAPDLIPYCA